MLKIGHIELPVPIMLSPMAGVSDLPFRLISRSFGSPLAFAEMIDINAISQKDKRTTHMLLSSPEDRPLGVQFLGNSELQIPLAIERLDGHAVDLIDFNAACPSPKVTRKGKGAALMKEPKKLAGILSALVREGRLPVAVKIRAGWDADSVNARDVALRAQDAGITCLFIHGRTKTQGYSGVVDYAVIRDVKEALTIPVIASGDNLSLEKIRRMFNETGCDGVAIARGALGNPWIFSETMTYMKDGTVLPKPDVSARIAVMKRHLEMCVTHWGEKRGVGIFHKFFIWYTRGLKGLRPLRNRAFRTGTKDGLIEVIDQLARQHPRCKDRMPSQGPVRPDITAH
ncbi:MAG: tRNA dihydrouridine synthase DusB [Syntrophorhabdaceae bacterium]|nr:tRNA dihydrouridine synthase DusB [Syntrophorhabdaceae bacterium]MDD4195681.1 tRNA dihydrouridine synthase DusB [Syntrophorhabdaceae bacterium]HOC45637.1 tRNA dihydrouridine synthase DusB [Syntrophorhabdaceae bacterium]